MGGDLGLGLSMNGLGGLNCDTTSWNSILCTHIQTVGGTVYGVTWIEVLVIGESVEVVFVFHVLFVNGK